MNKLCFVFIVVSLVGCATKPKKEYEYVLADESLASTEMILEVKNKCEFDKKMEEAKGYIGTAMSIARYESQYDKSSSESYTKKAVKLMFEASSCLKEGGLISREKVKP